MLILASASPRRRELLQQIHVVHAVEPAHIDETRRPQELPEIYVHRLALEKAHAVAKSHPGDRILAADTTVTVDGDVLNKPRHLDEAEQMLRRLAARTHLVHTGLALVSPGRTLSAVETTSVTFGDIPPVELSEYLASGDCLDKAGGYGIQGYAARWVTRIEGDFYNVVGLPLALTVQFLRQVDAGVTMRYQDRQAPVPSTVVKTPHP